MKASFTLAVPFIIADYKVFITGPTTGLLINPADYAVANNPAAVGPAAVTPIAAPIAGRVANPIAPPTIAPTATAVQSARSQTATEAIANMTNNFSI